MIGDHVRACKEEKHFVSNCSYGLPVLFFCIVEHIYILGDPLYFKVIPLHLIMQSPYVQGVATSAPRLEVREERLWRDVGVERLCVPEFLHPRILDDGEDELCSLALCCLIGAAVGALGLVRRFCSRADDRHGIFIDCRVIGSDV